MIEILTGIYLPAAADVGPGLYIGHFGGIVVGADVTMGSNCNISQGVTIGVSGFGDRRGSPVIGSHVYIAPGAKVSGRIRVGDYVTIGANAVVTKDVPDGAVVVGIPARVLRIDPTTASRITRGDVD
jgi:serine O-acetyltransferase